MSDAAAAGLLALGALGTVLLIIIVYLVLAIALWKIFQKMGEPGWKGLIPFYNLYTQYKHTWKTSMFWVLLVLAILSGIVTAAIGDNTESALNIVSAIISLAIAVVTIIGYYNLYKSFGHGIGWVILTIFFPHIMLLVLGFGSSRYLGNASMRR